MTTSTPGVPLPAVPAPFIMPFYYASLSNCDVYYLVDPARVAPFLHGTGLSTALFGGKAVVAYNYQIYAGQFSAGLDGPVATHRVRHVRQQADRLPVEHPAADGAVAVARPGRAARPPELRRQPPQDEARHARADRRCARGRGAHPAVADGGDPEPGLLPDGAVMPPASTPCGDELDRLYFKTLAEVAATRRS